MFVIAAIIEEDNIEKESAAGNYFYDLMQDYKRVAKAEVLKSFSFTPDTNIENPGEFTDELMKYARENNHSITITKECMYPEFELDGLLYQAERHYVRMGMRGLSVPVAVVNCTLVHPEDAEEEDIPEGKRRIMKWFHRGIPFVVGFLALAILTQNVWFALGITGILGIYTAVRSLAS